MYLVAENVTKVWLWRIYRIQNAHACPRKDDGARVHADAATVDIAGMQALLLYRT